MPPQRGPRRPSRPAPAAAWDGAAVRALRERMGATQGELAAELGVRQQTVSEWETGAYQPRGASARMLSRVAEEAEFPYTATSSFPAAADSASAPADGEGGRDGADDGAD